MNGKLTNEDIKALKAIFETVTYKLPAAMVKEINSIFEESRRNCLKCIHWDIKMETCEKYKQRPPLNVIVAGCPDFDDVPF